MNFPNANRPTLDSLYHASLLVIPLALAAFLLHRWMGGGTNDDVSGSTPYGLFHLALNKLPGEREDQPPKTEWLNMGYWKDASTFPDACRALALEVIKAANMRRGDDVLDVGFGTGECIMLLLSDAAVPRPSTVSGITDLELHVQRTRKRVREVQGRDPASSNVEVNLFTGDAVYRRPDLEEKRQHHPFDPSSPILFDAILATDCAYHFNTRRRFLSQSFSRLQPGGRIALADICFSSALPSWRTWAITRVIRMMSIHNIVSKEDYVQQMLGIGFENVKWAYQTPACTWKHWAEANEAEEPPPTHSFVLTTTYPGPLSTLTLPNTLGTAMTAIQAIFIRTWEERISPKPHIVYKIEVQAHVRSWQMWRRYSEFDDLHTELTKSTKSAPPAPLPPKHPFSSVFRSATKGDPKILEERRSGLEAYLRAILSTKEEVWRENQAFKDFLGIPVGRQGTLLPGSDLLGGAQQFTSATWLDEHSELQARLRDVWADINKRDALASTGDVAASHKSNIAAKSKLAGVLARIGNLQGALKELGMSGMSEGELQRRTDMVARLRDDCEKLSRIVTVARQTSARAAAEAAVGAGSSTGGASRAVVPESDRNALLGSNAFARPARRVFGASSPPKETETTRPLDNQGLMSLQQQQMTQQDNDLSQLTTILQRQRHLGEAIGAEVASQIEMLDDLNNEVDRVGGKLTSAKHKLNKLS